MSSTSGGGGGAQLVTMLFTFVILMIPVVVLNVSIAKRKGKNAAEYGWLSVIPFVGYFLAIYLISLTDKSLQDKVDRILVALAGAPAPEAKTVDPGSSETATGKTDKWENQPPKGY